MKHNSLLSHKKQLIILSGTTKSSLNILAQCVGVLGGIDLYKLFKIDGGTINQILFQDLGHSPEMIGPLPADWLNSQASKKARKRIAQLLEPLISSNDRFYFLKTPYISRLLPLWLGCLQEAGVSQKILFLLEHPFEVSISLSKESSISLEQAHLVWFVHLRDLQKYAKSTSLSFITLNQLVADPIFTLQCAGEVLKLTWPCSPVQMSHTLLTLIQPPQNLLSAVHLTRDKKNKFQVFQHYYDAIRMFQASQWTRIHNRQQAMENVNRRIDDKGVEFPDFIGNGVMDSLLRLVGLYEQKERKTGRKQITHIQSTDLFATLFIPCPSSEKNGNIKQFPLKANQWERIETKFSASQILADIPMSIRPLNINGIVIISSIVLINQASQKSVWSAKSGEEFDQLTIQGTAVRIPGDDADQLTILCTGDGAKIVLPLLKIDTDIPLTLQVWIKAGKDQSDIHDSFLLLHRINQFPEKAMEHPSGKLFDGLTIPENEEDIVKKLLNEKSGMTTKEKFFTCCELAKYHIKMKNNLKAMHYLGQAGNYADNKSVHFFKMASLYSVIHRDELALDLYTRGLFEMVFSRQEIKSRLLKVHSQMMAKAERSSEHGHELLMSYLRGNISYYKKKTDHQLTMIEIGTTREDVPGQGSTKKLAHFCKQHEMQFITVDMDPRNTELARHDLNQIDKNFQAITQKGEDFLKDYNEAMDFVFLDAYDFDHGKHSEERQSRYEHYLGARISDAACHRMHLECVQHIKKKLSSYGVICFDDTWFEKGKWRAKGTLAIPWLLHNSYHIILTGNKSALLVKSPKNINKTNEKNR